MNRITIEYLDNDGNPMSISLDSFRFSFLNKKIDVLSEIQNGFEECSLKLTNVDSDDTLWIIRFDEQNG